MDVLSLFGVGAKRILAQGFHTEGIVTRVYRCWWFSVKTKPARLYATPENTCYPHIITFTYNVNGSSHEGKLWIGVRYRTPQLGEKIEVCFDAQNPEKYACYAFGPGPCAWL